MTATKTKKKTSKRKTATSKNPSSPRKKKSAHGKRPTSKNPSSPRKKKCAHGKHAEKKNPSSGRKKHHRPRRRNPGWSNAKTIGLALLAGAGAAVGSAWVADGPLGNQSPAFQNGALALETLAAIYWIENPALAAGVVVGLLAVPVASVIYKIAPTLANPTPMGAPPASAALPPGTTVIVPATSPTMSALHRRALGKVRKADELGIGALHRPVGALHRPVGALHRPMSALHPSVHQGAIGAVVVTQAFGRTSGRYSYAR